jgi:mannose-6-phosphate isomerase
VTHVAADSGPVRAVGAGRVDKPWGYEMRWAVTERYAGKLIHIARGHSLSLQYHVQKEESIHLISGAMDLQLENDSGEMQTHRLGAGMSAHIRPGRRHRFVAVEDTDIFEVSSPEIDDVVRIEDNYGRAGTSAP